MARGAGSGYRGAVGETRAERILYTCPCGTVKPVEVYRAVNASTHPELAQRFRESTLNTVTCPDREPAPVNVSVVYHDPERAAFVLVIPTTARHTELAERSSLLAQLAADCEYELPSYARNFSVAFGADELLELLDTLDQAGAREERIAEKEQELAKRRTLLEQDEQAFAEQKREFERVVAELEQRNQELQERVAELDRRAEEMARSKPSPALPRARKRDPEPTPLPQPVPHEEIQTNPVELLSPQEISDLKSRGVDPESAAKRRAVIEAVIEEEQTGSVVSPGQIVAEEDSKPAGRAVSDQDETNVGATTDIAIERWIVSREPELKLADERGVRLAATATTEELEGLLGDEVNIKVQLHRLPTFPLAVIAIGAPAATREPFCFLFDVTKEGDRGVLNALAREFVFDLYLYDREYMPVQRRHVVADLAENVRFALAAADEHLRAIPVDQRSYNKAHILWSSPEFDRHGRRRPERALYRRDVLDQLDTPGDVRTALELVANFSRPGLEELLVLVLGEPLPRWNQQRGKVVLKAVELGLWPGPELAQLAVSTGAARSRKDLVQRLMAAFERTTAAGAAGMDAEAIAANWAALRTEAEGLGLAVEAGRDHAIVSGTIGGDTSVAPGGNGEQAAASPLAGRSIDELIALLGSKQHRRDAAVELCARGDARAVGPVFASLDKMTRAEAVHVLGNVVKLGEAAAQPLLQGLRSGKGFLRHGCALALGVLKDEAGIEAVCDQLLNEPTEIWRELARSVGEVGRPAVMSLVSRLRGQDDAGRERIAWALANIAARDGSDPVQTLAEGRDAIAAGVARHALELASLARNDDAAVRGPAAPRDQTVNRAFSRKFFEAMNRSDVATDDDDALLLDEADLIDADAEILDESDLIPT